MKGDFTTRRRFLRMCAGTVIGTLVAGPVVTEAFENTQAFAAIPSIEAPQFRPGDIVVLTKELGDLNKGLRGIIRRLHNANPLVVEFADNIHENPFSKSSPGFIPQGMHRYIVDSKGNRQLVYVIDECEFLFRPGDRVELVENLSFRLTAGRQGIVSFIEDESSIGVHFDRDELVTVIENYRHVVLYCNKL